MASGSAEEEEMYFVNTQETEEDLGLGLALGTEVDKVKPKQEKRPIRSDEEVSTLLNIIIEKKILSILDGKKYKKNYIFKLVQKHLEKKGVNNFEGAEINPVSFKKHVMSSMKTLFGETGVARNIDVLTYNQAERRGILRCPTDIYVKLRGALTLYESHNKSSFLVLNSSPLLLSLVSNSRTYLH